AYDNRNFIRNDVKISKNVSSLVDDVVFDPQTSGGLLIALSEDDANKLVKKLHESGQVGNIIGKVKEKSDHFIEVI
ncbi:MAG: AIR synthase-related protein, partial [Finegoldia magna]